jgi:CHC2-type zinc finger protein/Toprim domain-containing protein
MGIPAHKITSEDIEHARAARIESVLEHYGIRLRRSGNELVGSCPNCGGTDRFSIHLRKQLWNCRHCKAETGDVIGLVQALARCSFADAVRYLAVEVLTPHHHSRARKVRAGEDLARATHSRGTQRVTDSADYERQQREKASWLWSQRRAIHGTPAERYLRARGFTKPIPVTLAYLPPHKPKHDPAMIAVYAFVDEPEPGLLGAPGNADAVHLTLLKPDGSGKAEVQKPTRTIASPCARPIVIAPPNDLLALAITEGIEDALSVHESTGLGAWAAGSAPCMPSLAAAVPNWIESVTICAHDDAGKRYALLLAEALDPRGIEILVEGLAP